MRSIDSDVRQIIHKIGRGDLDTAQELFQSAARRTSVSDVARALGAATKPAAGTIAVGPNVLVYGNPYRVEGYSWRCGSCRWTANSYKTRQGAEKSAGVHAGEHPGIRVRWITRPIGA